MLMLRAFFAVRWNVGLQAAIGPRDRFATKDALAVHKGKVPHP